MPKLWGFVGREVIRLVFVGGCGYWYQGQQGARRVCDKGGQGKPAVAALTVGAPAGASLCSHLRLSCAPKP